MAYFPDGKDYYGVLGIRPDATVVEIKKAYRDLALKHHTDKSNKPESSEIIKDVNEAKRILLDDGLRQSFDMKMARYKKRRPHQVRFEDIFVSLEQLLVGCTKTFETEEGVELVIEIVPGCETEKVFHFTTEYNSKLWHAYEITVREIQHKRFTRSGEDLIHKVEISITDAINGINLEIPTLTGGLLILPIPGVDPVEKDEKVFQKQELGFPSLSVPGQRGRLLVFVKVGIFFLEWAQNYQF